MAGRQDERDVARANQSREENTRRFFADSHEWSVREVAAPQFDRRGGTHLIFECVEIMRRLRHFPENWYELSDDELYALSMRVTREE